MHSYTLKAFVMEICQKKKQLAFQIYLKQILPYNHFLLNWGIKNNVFVFLLLLTSLEMLVWRISLKQTQWLR